MTSQVTICNMALGHVGAATRVTSISPSDGSVEADRCAMFYPHARRALIEAAQPRWAQKRVALALAGTNDSEVWAYAYVRPSDCIQPLRVLSPSAAAVAASITEGSAFTDAADLSLNEAGSADFEQEGDVIFTHEPEAVLLYLRDVDDATKPLPSGVMAMSYMLASLLAGGTIKGRPGAGVARAFYDLAVAQAARSAASEANASHSTHQVIPPWMRARR